jgi:hypothetical protein
MNAQIYFTSGRGFLKGLALGQGATPLVLC